MADKILFVDDDPAMLAFFQMLEASCPPWPSESVQIETMLDAEGALAALAGGDPYAVVVSDMHMPRMNGIQFLHRVRQLAPDTIRMMLTASDDLQVAVQAVNDGNIFRFLNKPCLAEDLIKALGAGLEQYRLVTAEKEVLEKTLTGSIQILSDMLAHVNATAFGRASRVRAIVKNLARQLKADNAWQLEVAALLSQIGCIAMPESVLRQLFRASGLTDDEEKMFSDHPRIGRDLVKQVPRLSAVADAIEYQEKRFDGSGPPVDSIKEERIPFGGRVLKVALDFDILQLRGITRQQALERMQQRSGWYDPRVIDALGAIVDNETKLVIKEVSVKALLENLTLIPHVRIADKSTPVLIPQFHQVIDRMILAEDVCTTKDFLVLSKGYKITTPLLERLRNYSRNSVIREPIRVWVPIDSV